KLKTRDSEARTTIMEPVGAVASVLTIVTAAVQVTKTLHDVLVDIKDAPEDIARLCDDIHSISTLLSSLEDTLTHEPYRRALEEKSPIIRSLEQLKTPLKACTTIIEAIQIKVAPFSDLLNTVKASKRSKTRWWSHKNATKELIDTFESTKQTLNIHFANISLQCNLCTVAMGAQPQTTDPVLGRRASTDTDAGFALRRYIEAASSIADKDSIGTSETDPDDAVEAFALGMREPPNVQELLHQAVILGRADLVRPLLAQGAELSKGYDDGLTSLLTAIEEGHEEVVKVILEEAANISRIGVAPETQDDEQGEYEEALWAAVSNRQLGVVKMLLTAQPRLPLWSATTLVHAVVIGSTEIAQVLIENGATVSPYISKDRAPLHHPTDRTSIEPEKLLEYSCVEAERGIRSPNPYKRYFRRHMSPLVLAASAGHAAMVDELLNAGADPRKDVSILHAVNDPCIIAKLLAADEKLHANSESTLLDMPDEHGETVLGVVARGGVDESRVKELLNFGAEPAARSRIGLTPLEIAFGAGFLVDTTDVQEVLAEAEEAYYGHCISIVHNGYSC
ncbi:MAG: hypothetical protein Q9180_006524, partial [Flavoplaca navasiana]